MIALHPKNWNIKAESSNTIYLCPMHPEIRQVGPGTCRICGMGLEPENALSEDDTELKDMSYRFWIGIFLSLPLLILNMGIHIISNEWLHGFITSPYFNWLQFILSTPIVLWCGWPFFERAWLSLRNRKLNMFTLIGLGVGVAYGYSIFVISAQLLQIKWLGSDASLDVYFEPAAVITTLVLLGQVLELKARSRTSHSIRQLLELAPDTAIIVKADGREEEIPVDHVHVGDTLRVRPGDKLPVDGILLDGHSTIDQSMITGESLPVEKIAGDSVTAGMINGTGSFTMRAGRVGRETLLAQIVDMVSRAQRTRAPIQRLADTISGYFIPAVILIALFTVIVWFIWGPEPKIGHALLASVAVLIIACPCALGLATPMSIMVGTGRGAREGILIKNAEALESLEAIDTLIVDKTGTLTEGKPHLTKVILVADTWDKSNLLMFSASLELGSEHPLAEAIVKGAEAEKIAIESCSDFFSLTGKGVTGVVQDHAIALGNKELMKTLDIDITTMEVSALDYHSQGHTVVFIAIDSKVAGFITVADTLKPNARNTIKELQDNGVNVIMLTGDNRITALAIAQELGIETIEAEVLPDHKYEYIRNLQHKGHKVAMVGDGVNDAPALAQADVGIAMGTGTDVAIESAGITLMSGNLKDILKARRLSQATMNNIRQNLFLAFIYNALSIPIAAGVLYPAFGLLLNPMIASAAMALSSVSVILNSLRLSKE